MMESALSEELAAHQAPRHEVCGRIAIAVGAFLAFLNQILSEKMNLLPAAEQRRQSAKLPYVSCNPVILFSMHQHGP